MHLQVQFLHIRFLSGASFLSQDLRLKSALLRILLILLLVLLLELLLPLLASLDQIIVISEALPHLILRVLLLHKLLRGLTCLGSVSLLDNLLEVLLHVLLLLVVEQVVLSVVEEEAEVLG